jgi:hypothetical protein
MLLRGGMTGCGPVVGATTKTGRPSNTLAHANAFAVSVSMSTARPNSRAAFAASP